MFLDSLAAKELFLRVIRRAKRKFRFGIEDFCLMGNHYHLIIKPGKGESLSAIMHWILGVFAQRYNRLTGTSGLVWNGRFFSRILTSLQETLREFMYIDANPVRAGLALRDWSWPFGGLGHHRAGRRDIVEKPPPWAGILLPRHCQLLIEEA
jgi:putative transposase